MEYIVYAKDNAIEDVNVGYIGSGTVYVDTDYSQYNLLASSTILTQP